MQLLYYFGNAVKKVHRFNFEKLCCLFKKVKICRLLL